MRVAIAGAGSVGRSIAIELLGNGHEVLLIDKDPRKIKVYNVPNAEWLLADACEISSLEDASLERCNVVIAATGDDKVNLVVSLLAKTEYGVPRVVARINHPNNEWLFNESWGVDVAVSTPRLLSALVEEAVSVGDLVRLMTFRQSEASLVELTMPADAPLAGRRIGAIEPPGGAPGVARAGRGADRPRPARRVAMAFATAAQGRVRRARRGDARALRRQPDQRHRDTGAAGGCRAGGGAAAAGRPLSDVGLADRVAGAAADAAGTCPLVGWLAVGPRADLRPAGSVRPGRDPPAAA